MLKEAKQLVLVLLIASLFAPLALGQPPLSQSF
jgi:hypothetical protein